MKNKMLIASFNRFEIQMPIECVNDCSHSGACDDDVEYWAEKLNLKINPGVLKEELQCYGAWEDAELNDHDQNLHRIIWLAAGQIKDDLPKDSGRSSALNRAGWGGVL